MKKKLLFLELPRLDNDVTGPQENLRLAGVYLRGLLERSAESRYFQTCQKQHLRSDARMVHIYMHANNTQHR